MSSEEEYLDQLLAQALNPKKSKPEEPVEAVEEEKPAEAEEPVVAEESTEPVAEPEEDSGDFDVQQTADVPELDMNSQGAKDFNLEGISPDELASEIEAFEEDADDSVLPTGEGVDPDTLAEIGDIGEIADIEDLGDIGEVPAELSGTDEVTAEKIMEAVADSDTQETVPEMTEEQP